LAGTTAVLWIKCISRQARHDTGSPKTNTAGCDIIPGYSFTEHENYKEKIEREDLKMNKLLSGVPWKVLIIACLTLGLAPFSPPHLWGKLDMLSRDQLIRSIDWLDLFFHASPWMLLVLKGACSLRK
jgi:hypothetical protein